MWIHPINNGGDMRVKIIISYRLILHVFNILFRNSYSLISDSLLILRTMKYCTNNLNLNKTHLDSMKMFFQVTKVKIG